MYAHTHTERDTSPFGLPQKPHFYFAFKLISTWKNFLYTIRNTHTHTFLRGNLFFMRIFCARSLFLVFIYGTQSNRICGSHTPLLRCKNDKHLDIKEKMKKKRTKHGAHTHIVSNLRDWEINFDYVRNSAKSPQLFDNRKKNFSHFVLLKFFVVFLRIF